MLVISDTGPLRYLVELDSVNILPELYGAGGIMTIPDVIQELGLPHFPAVVGHWAASPPAWLQVESPQTVDFLDRLDLGEASAISLARERKADLVLVDERDGTSVARGLGFEVYGTLGVLALAGARGKVNFEAVLELLTSKTMFRATSRDLERARQRYREICGALGP